MGQPVTGHFRLQFPSNYIGAPDLREKDVTVLIDRVERAALKIAGTSKSENKIVLYMRNPKTGVVLGKAIVLNKTNATTIASLHGNKVEAWGGKPITLYPTTCKFGPATVDCVRIRTRPGRGSSGEIPDAMAADPDPAPVEEDELAALTEDDDVMPPKPKTEWSDGEPAAPHDPHSDPPPPAGVKLGTDREPGQEG